MTNPTRLTNMLKKLQQFQSTTGWTSRSCFVENDYQRSELSKGIDLNYLFFTYLKNCATLLLVLLGFLLLFSLL